MSGFLFYGKGRGILGLPCWVGPSNVLLGCLLTLARLARELLTSQLVMTNELKCLLSLLETYNEPSELMSDEFLVQP